MTSKALVDPAMALAASSCTVMPPGPFQAVQHWVLLAKV